MTPTTPIPASPDLEAPRSPPHAATRVLGLEYTNLDYAGVAARATQWIAARESRSIAVAPVSSLMLARFDRQHRAAMASADLVTADGVPIVWAQRLLGHPDATRVYGPTLMLELLSRAERSGWRVGLHGGHPDRLDTLVVRLRERYPRLILAHVESPPFRPLTEVERTETAKRISDRRVQLLFLGLGCPKQERWMNENRGCIDAVMVGVGAAFDFHAGAVRQAPPAVQRLGLEWAFRLACEPRRLWRRYATTIPPFIAGIGLQLAAALVLRRRYQIATSARDTSS